MTVLSMLGEAAIEYARRGWRIFPCTLHGKAPLTDHGLKDASTNEPMVREWWTNYDEANIGHPTGEHIVLDVDGLEGERTLAALEKDRGALPETLVARTGRGRHLYFKANGTRLRNSAGKLGPHLDIRGEGGYVIVPPSIHWNGKRYEWLNPDVEIALLPAWIAAALAEPEQSSKGDSGAGEKITEGRRNTHLTSLGGAMRRKGMTPVAIEAALQEENSVRCAPPLDEDEVKAIAQSVGRYEPAKAPKGFILTPLGELLKKPATPVEYIWEQRLVAGTVSAVVSKPKVGKSTFARNFCLKVSRGEDYLGPKTEQGECIYLALEEREDDVRDDFRAMGADGSEPILIHAAAAPADGIRAACELVRERKPRLVVIDPIIRLARIKDEKAYAETYAALSPLIDVARETGTHLMLTHHSAKAVKADPVDSPLGSTAIGGAVSTLIVLKRHGQAYRTIQTVQRIGPDMPETILDFDSETKRLTIGLTRHDAECMRLQQRITEYLSAAGESKTEPEIAEDVEAKTAYLREALRELVKDGTVSREGAGKRGDPYRYSFSFSCSHNINGTREQETEKAADTCMNAERKLVPSEA